MRLVRMLPALVLCAALPAGADKRLDEAVAKAEQQLARGKADEAVKILQKAAEQARRDPEGQLALARLLTKLGRLDEAGTALARAGELASAVPAAARARVLQDRSAFALRAGTVRDALDLARAAVEAAAGAESLAALARAQARAGDPAARDTASRAVDAGPSSVAAHVARGEALREAWLGKDSEAACRRALDLEPRSVAAQIGLGLALAAQGKAGPALEAARAAARADPTSAEAQAAVGLALLVQDPLDRTGEAVSAVQQASFLEPKSALAKVAVGRVFESRGQLPQAAGAYDQAGVLDPTWGAPPIGALRVELREGDAKGALARLRALPDELKASGEADLLLGQLLSRTDDPMGAKAALDRAVAAMPGRAEAQAAHGAAAYDVGELTLAADALGRAVALEPANPAYLHEHGLYLAYDGRLDEGLAALLAASGRPEGQSPAAFIELGWVYRSFKPPRVAEAVAAYERALKLDPRSGEAALGVARSYRAGKQWARAADAYERIPAANPRLEGEAMLGAAWCFLRSGDDYKARFYTGLAARAGADVRGLRTALSGSSPSAGDEVAELAEGLGSRNAGVQVRAARGLLGLGRAAVPSLASALARPATSIAARETIVEGLGKMGPAARDALPQLDRLIKAGPPKVTPPDTPVEKGRQERETRLIGTMESAAASIRGK
jgi:tetratricopeptide (TPR) repeat protein